MIKQFLKIAGVKTEKDLLRKYGTEDAFFAAHPEAKMLVHAAMGGSYYQDGGSPLYSTQGQALRNFMNTVAYSGRNRFDDGGMAPQEMNPQAAMVQQGPPPPDQGQAGPDGQLQEVIKFIVQSLQQGMAPEQVIAKLVEMGVPQDQAGELVQGVVQQLQGGQQQGPQEEMAEGAQGQEAPPQEMMEGQPPMGKWGGMYAAGGEPCPGEGQIRNEQGTCVCGPGYDTDEMTGQCIWIGDEEEGGGEEGMDTQPAMPNSSKSLPGLMPRRGAFNAGLGLKGKGYNFDYGFGVNGDFKTGVHHNFNLGLPNFLGGLDLGGNYNVGKNWGANMKLGIPVTSKSKISLTGNVNQLFNDPELRNMDNQQGIMYNSGSKKPVSYGTGIQYDGKLFGEKGPDVKISANYNKQKYGGLSKFVDGGAPEQGGGQDQQQQIIQQVAQALQQGAQPEQVMQQLVQMGMPQDQAQQLIEMIMQQMQGGGQQQPPMAMYGMGMKMGGTPCYNCGGSYANGGDTDNGTYYQGMYMAYGGPYIPLYSGGGDNNYRKGGSVKKYKKGGEYDMSENEIQDLIKKGYKIQYL